MKRSGARLFCSTVTLYYTEDLFRDFFFKSIYGLCGGSWRKEREKRLKTVILKVVFFITRGSTEA